MELNIDLLEKQKKNRSMNIIFGTLLFILTIFMLVWIITNKNSKATAWVQLVFWVPYFSYFGSKFLLESFFGKAHVLVNSEIISLKATVFKKEQSANWSEINSIDYKPGKLKINKTDNTTKIIDISTFDYILVSKIKETMDFIAKEKNKQLNFGQWK